MSVIVSLTSYKERLPTLHICLESIFSQSYKPDKMILYLHERETEIPAGILAYQQTGLYIRYFLDDCKPHNKYLHAMREYPGDIIITLDDDVIYPFNLLELLMLSHSRYPNAVSAGRAHGIRLGDDGHPLPYIKWDREARQYDIALMRLMACGVGGVLYPPGCMHTDVLDVKKIRELCLYADDVWLKFMQLLHGTPVVLIKQEAQHPPEIPEVAGEKLLVQNKLRGRNDQYINLLTNVYGIQWERMLDTNEKAL